MTADLGWQVLDPDGNVVASGPVVIAEMADEFKQQIADAFGLTLPDKE